jgi:hypothetical protein
MLPGSAPGGGWRDIQPKQVEFAPLQQFPLDVIPRVEADGRRQGQGKTHVEPGLLAFGADRLDFQGIGRFHFFQKSSCFW